MERISWRQFRESKGVEDWRNLSGGAGLVDAADAAGNEVDIATTLSRD